jgi:hypothetical protein
MVPHAHSHSSVLTLRELREPYVDDRKREEFFLYVVVDIACGSGHCTWNSSLNKGAGQPFLMNGEISSKLL